jgi:hypothetical protein
MPLHQAPLHVQKMQLAPHAKIWVKNCLKFWQRVVHCWYPKPKLLGRDERNTATRPRSKRSPLLEGWPKNKANAEAEIKPYWTCKNEISCVDGLLLKGNKLVVPKSLRPQVLDIIHESHQGIVKSKQPARDRLYWPGMRSQIHDRVFKCQVCSQLHKTQARDPMITSKILGEIKIGVDLFEDNKTNYLLNVDYHSKWIVIA